MKDMKGSPPDQDNPALVPLGGGARAQAIKAARELFHQQFREDSIRREALVKIPPELYEEGEHGN